MSSDEIDFVKYGSSLEPLNEDELPKKKPCILEEQVVKDKQGRRRFHGAFTGGFSAGYFNTVGSTTGWKPSSFRSSKSKKQEIKIQKPEHFMDEEDTAEFGIAPMVLKTRGNYLNEKKNFSTCNISCKKNLGEFVVKNYLRPVRETIGTELLKKMGWKSGQGIGPRIIKKDKKINLKFRNKIYGCNLPPGFFEDKNDSDSNSESEDIKFAPTDCTSISFTIKPNFFGIGYQELQKNNFLGSFSDIHYKNKLFKNKSNEKYLSVGHGFGVGVFEDEDEDIYLKDDKDQYDFFLTHESQNDAVKTQNIVSIDGIIDGFTTEIKKNKKKNYLLPTLPDNFNPSRKIANFCENIKKKYEVNGKYDFNQSKKKLNNQSQLPEKSHNFKPFTNITIKKFLVASEFEDFSNPLNTVDKFANKNEDCIRAAKMKIFGVLTRKIEEWEPSPLLSKRFNIPEQKNISQNFTMENKNKFLDDISSSIAMKKPNQDVEKKMEHSNFEDPTALEKEINFNLLKTDLFKEIFIESDSASETEKHINLKEQKIEAFEEKIINNKRNTSPPRGIFEHINIIEKSNEKFSSACCSDNNYTDILEDFIFGPKIPNKIIKKYDFGKTNEVFEENIWTEKTVKTQSKQKKKKSKKSSHKVKHKHKKKKKKL